MKTHIEVINGLSKVVRQRYGDNAVEALVGALSSVCTAKQLEALFDRWSKDVK
jgi:hypothetical protein